MGFEESGFSVNLLNNTNDIDASSTEKDNKTFFRPVEQEQI
ncbi:MAG: hypothetical protein AB4372_33290 [Xenococcus sp. (in: cyanobacteria)]